MFLKDYTNYEKMMSFVPQHVYYNFSAANNPKYNLLIDDKIIFHDLMTQYGLPVPIRFFTFRRGEFRNGAKMMTDIEVDNVICSIDDDRIFVKRFTGGAASGVSILTIKGKGVYYDIENEEVTASMIRRKFSTQDVFLRNKLYRIQY